MGSEGFLAEYLERTGLTQYKLAQLSGVTQSHISKIVRGLAQPKPETLKKLAPALGVSDSELMIRAGYLQDMPVESIEIPPGLAHQVAILAPEEKDALSSLLAAGPNVKRLLDIAADNPDLTADDLRAFIRVISKTIASSTTSSYPPASPSK